LQALSNTLGVGESVRFLGMRSDVAALLPAFDVFVHPSLLEGLSRAVMEAMAAGLPCVVFDVGGNREAVRHDIEGFVLPLTEPEAFERSVVRLVQDDLLRARMGNAARTAAF